MATETPTLSARIRCLAQSGVRPSEIARHLGTSMVYVRVVLRHRKGGQSKYDRAYKTSEIGRTKRSQRLLLEYNIVPKDERIRLRFEYYEMLRSQGGMSTKDECRRAWAAAHGLVRRRGREILARSCGAQQDTTRDTDAGLSRR